MDCPKCKSTNHIKYGQVGGRQRHRCKNCDFKYTVSEVGKPMSVRKAALKLYLEGIGFRSIGRILEVSHVSVINWIRNFGEQVAKEVELTSPAPIIEMDELHTYIGEKKTTTGCGRRLTGSKKCSSVLELEQGELALAINCIKK